VVLDEPVALHHHVLSIRYRAFDVGLNCDNTTVFLRVSKSLTVGTDAGGNHAGLSFYDARQGNVLQMLFL
jgi:hypothetical protein